MLRAHRSKSGPVGGPLIQGYNAWDGGISMAGPGGPVDQKPAGTGVVKGQTRSERRRAAAGITAAAGPAGRASSRSRRAADDGTAGRRKQRPAGVRSRDGATAVASGQPGAPSVSHRVAVPRHWAVRDLVEPKVTRYSAYPLFSSLDLRPRRSLTRCGADSESNAPLLVLSNASIAVLKVFPPTHPRFYTSYLLISS